MFADVEDTDYNAAYTLSIHRIGKARRTRYNMNESRADGFHGGHLLSPPQRNPRILRQRVLVDERVG